MFVVFRDGLEALPKLGAELGSKAATRARLQELIAGRLPVTGGRDAVLGRFPLHPGQAPIAASAPCQRRCGSAARSTEVPFVMTTDFESARRNMIEQQVRPWGVLEDRILGFMAKLPRERFVPDAYQGLAYADIEVPIGLAPSQCMLAPKIVGRLVQALAIESTDRVYEIGTGSGYLTACLAELGDAVHSVEIDPDLADQARERLIALETPGRIEIKSLDAMIADSDAAPFGCIAVTGSLPTPAPLARLREQLTDGGRLFAFVGQAPVMEAVLVTRISQGRYRQETLFETCVPALVNAPAPEAFAF